MQTTNIRRSFIRLTGIVAIVTGLAMSSGIAAAGNTEVGLTECDQAGCAVVTVNDVKQANAERDLAPYRPTRFPSGPYDPQFTR
ncbi:MAG: hypothetical protein WD628_04575 [Thermomicrobiales bacterium]